MIMMMIIIIFVITSNNYYCSYFCCMPCIDSDRMKMPAELKRHNFQTPSWVLMQFQVAHCFLWVFHPDVSQYRYYY